MKAAGRLLLVLVGGVALSALSLRAAEDSYVNGMADKFTHGLVNAATGWMELPMQTKKGWDRGLPCLYCPASRTIGGAKGVCRGVSHTLGRTLWGAWELVTFWAPNPTTNEDVLLLLDGFYAWEEGTFKPLRCPTAKDGFKRIGMRLERGIDDVAGSFMEVPGQIKKSQGACDVWGVPKGLYYMLGRVFNGVGDIALAPLPSHVDQLMVPFDEVKPWDAFEGNAYNNIGGAAAQ